MISLENKIKFIEGKAIELDTVFSKFSVQGWFHISARYECCKDWEFGSIIGFRDKLFKDYSCVKVRWNDGSNELFLSETYKFKPSFERMGSDFAFRQLRQELKDQIIEYCDWIVSQEGRDFVKRIGKLKVFI